MKAKNTAAKTAIGGMMTALSLVLMLPTAFDLLEYALPALAGILTLFCVIELGKGWAFGIYAATSLLGVLVLPNKKAIVLYIVLFGYYAILKAVFESKLKKPLEILLKILVFNAAVFAAFFIMNKIMGIPLEEMLEYSDSVFWAKYAIPIFLIVGNLVFLFYDYVLTIYAGFYIKVLQKRFRQLFRL